MGSCCEPLGPQLVKLFGEVVDPLGHGTQLVDVGCMGQAFEGTIFCSHLYTYPPKCEEAGAGDHRHRPSHNTPLSL